jgi:hypothetical protein
MVPLHYFSLGEKGFFSVYPTTEDLQDTMDHFLQPGTLTVLDLAHTLAFSPEYVIVGKNVFLPRGWKHWMPHPKGKVWFKDLVLTLKDAWREDWDKTERETFAIKYATENVLPHFPSSFLRNLAERDSPGFYLGAKRFVEIFEPTDRVLLSRGFQDVVDCMSARLGLDKGYGEEMNKSAKALALMRAGNYRRAIVVGDLPLDMQIARDLRENGYETLAIQVAGSSDDYIPGATIMILRDSFSAFQEHDLSSFGLEHSVSEVSLH